jgi:hypothetical protein
MPLNSWRSGYSADVRMELRLDDCILPIGQLGPEFIILRDAPEHAPTEGEIHMWIDDKYRWWRVRLPEGISAKNELTKIA